MSGTGQLRGQHGLVPKCISDHAVSEPRQWGRVTVYARDVVVKRKWVGLQSPPPGGTRGVIAGLSRAARRRLLLTARNLQGLCVLLTLTYPAEFPVDGRRVKRDWSVMRKWLVRRGVSGLWFLEFQERGAAHVHVFLTGPVPKDEVSEAWYGIVASGDTRHLRAGTSIEWLRAPHAPAAYAAKYAVKQSQKVVPLEFSEVGRFWGLFGGLRVERVQVAGELVLVSGVIRTARRAHNATRRVLGWPEVKDGGRRGFTAWNVGPVMRGYVDAEWGSYVRAL